MNTSEAHTRQHCSVRLICSESQASHNYLKQLPVILNQDHVSIKSAGDRAAIILYNGRTSDNLKELRSDILTKRIMNSKIFVEPKYLPSTEAALKIHSYKSYFQVMKWMDVNDMNPEEWGWPKQWYLLPHK